MSPPVSVFQIVPALNVGGCEKMVLSLVQALDRTRYRPTVVCLRERGCLAGAFEQEGVEVTMPPRVGGPLGSTRGLARLLAERKAEVMHSHSGTWHVAALAGRLARVPARVHTEHGRPVPDLPRVIWQDRLAARETHATVAVSEALHAYLTRRLWLSPKRVRTIENGLDPTPFAIAPIPADLPRERPLIGVVSRLEWPKDLDSVLRSLPHLLPTAPNAQLLIAGVGPDEARLRALATELRIADRVHFLGQREDVPGLLRAVDVYVLSSRSEGLSLSLLEAMAAGRPVVATAVGGNPELVEHGVNGLLVPPENPRALAKSIGQLLSQREVATELGMRARATVDARYHVQRMAREYEALYAECLHDRK